MTTQRDAGPPLLTSGGPLHRLTEQADPDAPAERPSSGVEPQTGTVHFALPDGEARFANSGTGPWLDTLHRYGTHVTTSASPTALRSTSPRRRKSRR